MAVVICAHALVFSSVLVHWSPWLCVCMCVSVLYCFYYYGFILYLKIWNCSPVNFFFFLIQNCFSYPGFLVVSYEFYILFSIFAKNKMGILMGITLAVLIDFGGMVIFAIWFYQSMSMGRPSIFLMSVSNPSDLNNFYCRSPSIAYLSLFLDILFSLRLLWMGGYPWCLCMFAAGI